MKTSLFTSLEIKFAQIGQTIKSFLPQDKKIYAFALIIFAGIAAIAAFFARRNTKLSLPQTPSKPAPTPPSPSVSLQPVGSKPAVPASMASNEKPKPAPAQPPATVVATAAAPTATPGPQATPAAPIVLPTPAVSKPLPVTAPASVATVQAPPATQPPGKKVIDLGDGKTIHYTPKNPVTKKDFEFLFNELEEQTDRLCRSIPTVRSDLTSTRFCNVECPIATQVKVEGGEAWGYFDANFVTYEGMKFISLQYPIKMEKFWIAAEKYANLILDITNQEDVKKTKTDCNIPLKPYAPTEPGQKMTFGKKEVRCEGTTTNFNPKSNKSKSYTCRIGSTYLPRTHCTEWEDHSGAHLDLLELIVNYVKPFVLDPKRGDRCPMIHCRAGNGRTGTVIVSTIIDVLIDKGIITLENLQEHMNKIIAILRFQRGPMFVQTDEQLETIWNYAVRKLKKKGI